jgi:AraC-like DNA-binding protein
MQSGLSAWIYAIVRALEKCGIASEPLLRDIGMDSAHLGDVNYRYSQEQVTSLWIAAVEATGDEHFGLKVARYVKPSTFHVVGYAMACSVTLRRALERFARSARLISDSAVVEFRQLGDTCRLEMDLNTQGRKPIYQTIDTMLAGVFLLCEWIRGASIIPVQVLFQHHRPAADTNYAEIFRSEIMFDQPINAIVFRASDLDALVPSANEELALMLDEMTSKYLAIRFSRRFSRKVRDALTAQFLDGEPTKAETAAILAMTERTLLRRLQEENTTFQEVLDHLREEKAFDYLKRSELTIASIANLLGFSSSSTFSRAFVRWTGQRPSAWRDCQCRMAELVPTQSRNAQMSIVTSSLFD